MSDLLPKCPSCHASLSISLAADPASIVVCDACGQEALLRDLLASQNDTGLDDLTSAAIVEQPLDDLPLDSLEDSEIELDFDELDDEDFVADLGETSPDVGTGVPLKPTDKPEIQELDTEDWLIEDIAGDETNLEHEDTLVEESRSGAFEFDGHFSGAQVTLNADSGKPSIDMKEDPSPTFEFASDSDPAVPGADAIESIEDVSASVDESETFTTRSAAGTTEAMAAPARRRGLVGNVLRALIVFFAVLVLLQFIVWWGLGIDPVGVAAVMPAPLDRIAPAQLRPSSARAPINYIPPPDGFYDDEEDEDPADDTGETSKIGDVAENASGIATPDDSALAGDEATESESPEPIAAVDEGPTPPPFAAAGSSNASPDGVAREGQLSNDLSRDADERVAAEADAGELLGAAAPPVVEEASEFADFGPRGFPTYTSEELAATFATALQTHQAFDQAYLTDSPETRKAAAAFYIAWCEMAERATLVDREGAEAILAESRAMMAEIAKEPEKQILLARWAVGWLSPRQRAKMQERTSGVVLAGEVQSVRPIGDYFEYRLSLLDNDRTSIVIVSRLHPERNDLTDFSKGARILVLGVEVDRPQDVLPTYEGNSPSVIYTTDEVVALP